MELRQLEYLVAVAEEASFTRAAARVHVAQPGVSAQIRRLERELGHELLDRSGRTVRLTEVGRAVLPFARAALAAVAGARSAVDELDGLVRGHVSMGMITACASLELADMLATFRLQHPGIEVSLAEANSDRLLEGVRDGTFDLAWVGRAGAPPAGIATEVLVDERLVAAVAPGDPLARRTTMRLGELCAHPLISLPRGTGMRASLDDACTAHGLTPQVALEASTPLVLAELACRQLGVAILPASLAAAYAGRLHVLTITRPELRSRLELAWRADGAPSPAARALVAHARASLVPARTAA
jgi:DNA-binding transcriptional LysR family regulator